MQNSWEKNLPHPDHHHLLQQFPISRRQNSILPHHHHHMRPKTETTVRR
jgi:hypothetical protein